MKILLPDNTEKEHWCDVCDSKVTHVAARIEDAPIYLGCTAAVMSKDQFLSFDVQECPKCGVVTTDTEIPEESYHQLHSEAVGPTWDRHHETLLHFIRDNLKNEEHRILEIGPSSRPIAAHLEGSATYYDLMERPAFPLKVGDVYRRATFPQENWGKEYADLVIASHVLEHAEFPSSFLREMVESAWGLFDEPDAGQVFFSIPHFQHWLERGYWNAITAEHRFYPFRIHLSAMAEYYRVKAEFLQFEEHSLMTRLYYREPSKPRERIPRPAPKGLARKWAKGIVAAIEDVEARLAEIPEEDESPVYLAGASHLSQYPYLMSEVVRQRVSRVLDNSRTKEELRLYGTPLKARRFEILRLYTSPVLVIAPSPYQKEMAKQAKSLNQDTRLILP